MIVRVAAVAAFTAGLLVAANTTPALSLSLSGLHDQTIEKGRLCFTDHFHLGSGKEAASKRASIASAIADWNSFAAGEYGDAWGSFKLAADKSAKCFGSGSTWECEIRARPCRRR